MPFNFMQLSANLLNGMAAVRRAFRREPQGGAAHSVRLVAPRDDGQSHRRVDTGFRAPGRSLLTRLAQVFQGRGSTRVAPMPVATVKMRPLSPAATSVFMETLKRGKPEPLVEIAPGGPRVAETFKKDLNRSAYFLANKDGRAEGKAINQVMSSTTGDALAAASNQILARLGGDSVLFERVTQLAQQAGLAGLPDITFTEQSPVKLNGRGVYVMDAAGGGRTDDSHKTYAIGLREPGVAVVRIQYSNQNIEGVVSPADGRVIPTDKSRSRLDLALTLEIDRKGGCRRLGEIQLGSIIVPAEPRAAVGAAG